MITRLLKTIYGPLLYLLLSSIVNAQQPGGLPVVGPNLLRHPHNGSSSSAEADMLKSNYRVTFSGVSGDKPLGELSTLTCAPKIELSGPLSSSERPASFSVSGMLSEKEGEMILHYQIGFSVPSSTPPGVPVASNNQYQQHSSSGTLRMKPGKSYEVLKCGGNVYTISISPESDK